MLQYSTPQDPILSYCDITNQSWTKTRSSVGVWTKQKPEWGHQKMTGWSDWSKHIYYPVLSLSIKPSCWLLRQNRVIAVTVFLWVGYPTITLLWLLPACWSWWWWWSIYNSIIVFCKILDVRSSPPLCSTLTDKIINSITREQSDVYHSSTPTQWLFLNQEI